MRSIAVLIVCLAACAVESVETVSVVEQAVIDPAESCVGHCGGKAAAGCSCEPTCSWRGTCCLDAVAVCQVDDDGLDYANIIAPRTAESTGIGGNSVIIHSTFLAPALPTDRSEGEIAGGLMGVSFGDIDDDDGELVQCAVHNDGETWYAEAKTTGDAKATCTAGAIRVPGLPPWLHGGRLKTEDYYHASTNGDAPPEICLPGTPADSIPILRTVWMDNNDIGEENTRCAVYVDPTKCGERWMLRAEGPNDSDAVCTARLLFMPLTASGYAEAGADQDNHGVPSFPIIKPNKRRARAETPLADEADHVCFLSDVNFRELDDGYERATCKIIPKRGKWTLVAEVTGWDHDTDSHAWCRATCAAIPEHGVFPNYNWPLPWPAVPTTTRLADGARMTLYQNGSYDRPLVVIEGFDPVNKTSARTHMVDNAPLIRPLEAAGFDIWIVDFEDAGQPLLDSAREAALAIDAAYRHANWNVSYPGKKLPVLGASMGGLVGKDCARALGNWHVTRPMV